MGGNGALSFGSILEELMGDLSQSELARETGVPQAIISRHLRGQTSPQLRFLLKYQRKLPKLFDRLKVVALSVKAHDD